MTAFLALVLMAGQAAAASTARPAPPRPGLSWEEADALGVKLDALDKRQKDGKTARAETVTVTEGELNSYLNLKAKVPDGVSDIEVHLDRDRAAATALVDLDRVQGKPPSSAWSPFNLLTGRVAVAVKGKLVAKEEGFAVLEVEEVRLGALPVPASALEQLVAAATRSKDNPGGVDILSPFRLPYTMKRVRLQLGRAFLDF
jgi:hypothetical protein